MLRFRQVSHCRSLTRPPQTKLHTFELLLEFTPAGDAESADELFKVNLSILVVVKDAVIFFIVDYRAQMSFCVLLWNTRAVMRAHLNT